MPDRHQGAFYYKVERGTGRDETGLMNFGMDGIQD
jgi:hypothetical protein